MSHRAHQARAWLARTGRQRRRLRCDAADGAAADAGCLGLHWRWRGVAIFTTARTPGILRISASFLIAISSPVNECAVLMAALSMPGTTMSMPKIALPLHFAGVSKRASGLPMSRNRLLSLSGGVALRGSWAAA